MSTPLSLDLRVRVLAAVALGASHREAGKRFGVSAASVSRWRALERETGDPRPKIMGGDQRSRHVEAHGGNLRWRSSGCVGGRTSESNARSSSYPAMVPQPE